MKKAHSLSFQSIVLIVGKFLSLPITFLIPIVMVRHFELAEFGQYKQLFMIFYIFLPFLDFGTSQGLIYYVPKCPARKPEVVSQYVFTQLIFCTIGLLLFFIFRNDIALLFTKRTDIADYIPIIAVFLALWVLSNNLEIFLTAEKESAQASLFIFFSDGVKGLAVISVLLLGGDLVSVLYVFVGVGVIRFLLMVFYLLRNNLITFSGLNSSLWYEQLKYSLPLGIAVTVNSFIEYTHQAIVSNQLSAVKFAIYSIGCFQVPIIGIFSLYVSRVAIVRICELHTSNAKEDIVALISSSFRKLSLIFVPVFFILWTTAEDFIRVLYTDTYLDSVPIFRVFIIILPLAVFLVEYVPRSLGDSLFVVKINVLTLIFNICLVIVLMNLLGIIGAAAGFVLSRAIRKLIIMRYIVKNLEVKFLSFFPAKQLGKIVVTAMLCLLPGLIFSNIIDSTPTISLLSQWVLYFTLCPLVFWKTQIIRKHEKKRFRGFFVDLWQKYVHS